MLNSRLSDFWHWWVLALLLVITSGCPVRSNTIEMEITEDGSARRLLRIESVADDPLSVAEVARLEQEFGTSAKVIDARTIQLEQTFRDALPGDLGGHARLVRHVTSLGTLVQYRERFRGTDDLNDVLHRRQQALRQLCDLIADWARSEAVDAAAGDQIHDFVRGPVHDDLWNTILLFMFYEARSPESPLDQQEQLDLRLRFQQLFVEREYITDADIPRLLRFHAIDPESLEGIALVVMLLDKKFQSLHQRPLTDALPILLTPTKLMESWSRFLSERYPRVENNSQEVPVKLALECIGNRFVGSESLDLSITAGTKPFETNGEWIAEQHSLQWSVSTIGTRPNTGPDLPTFFYASWSFPNAEQQQSRFGRVLLHGETLGRYVEWRMSLTVDEGVDWDLLLLSLSPDDDLETRFAEFSFTSADSTPEARQSLEQTIRQIMHDAAN